MQVFNTLPVYCLHIQEDCLATEMNKDALGNRGAHETGAKKLVQTNNKRTMATLQMCKHRWGGLCLEFSLALLKFRL